MADSARCPVTRPGPFVPPSGVSSSALFGADGEDHGNGQLWVGGLWPDGVIVAGPEFVGSDGSISTKFGWYRVTPGLLTITGRRLDAPRAVGACKRAQRLWRRRISVQRGEPFPTEGCWEITGAVRLTSLTLASHL